MTTRVKLGAQGLAVGLVLALLSLLIWKVAFENNGGGVAAAIDHGKVRPAPDFTLRRLDRPGKLTLSSLRGKPVVLNFWASWCYPCKLEAPLLARAWKRHRGRVVLLGLDVNDFTSDARQFMRKYGVKYPVVQDNQNRISPKYGLTGLPETFFIDRRGRVVGHVAGQISASELRAGIEEARRA